MRTRKGEWQLTMGFGITKIAIPSHRIGLKTNCKVQCVAYELLQLDYEADFQ